MALLAGLRALVFSLLIVVVFGGTHQDGAYLPSRLRQAGQLPLPSDNYTLFRSGGSLQTRQLQGCSTDPSSIQCGNSTVCCSQEYPVCCIAQDWCCESGYQCSAHQACCTPNRGYHGCPGSDGGVCCEASDNCFTTDYCCPKTAATCGRSDFCLSDSQSCCDGDPSGYCDTGYECMSTGDGASKCCKSGQTACSGGYCCDEGHTCAGSGICKGPQTTSSTPAPTQNPTGSATSASSTPGHGGVLLTESSLSPLLSLLLVGIPFGLLL